MTISQREARRLRKRVEELEGLIERERCNFSAEYVGGVHIGTFEWTESDNRCAAIHTARRLGHAVVACAIGYRGFNVYALPHPKGDGRAP